MGIKDSCCGKFYYLILNVHLQAVSVIRAKVVDRGEPNISNIGSIDKIEDWINSFQHEENDTKTQVVKKIKPRFRVSYLTYLKLLSELDLRTKSSEEKMKEEEESEDIIFPPSHSLTQTDREYFNIVRTEDGQSQFARQQDRERLTEEDEHLVEKLF